MSEQPKECSELFEDVFNSHGGSIRSRCVCGRTYFEDSPTAGDWEEGELEELREGARREPDKYIGRDGTVYWMHIDGSDIVYDCRCDTAWKYERFVLDNSDRIAEYLRKRAAAFREKADRIDVPVDPKP